MDSLIHALKLCFTTYITPPDPILLCLLPKKFHTSKHFVKSFHPTFQQSPSRFC